MRDTILLADSSANRRGALCDILDEAYNVLEANTVDQAQFYLEHNRSGLAAVVITDELLAAERALGRESFISAPAQQKLLADIAVILSLSSNLPEEEIAAYDEGADAVIHWPYHPSLVKRTVTKIAALYDNRRNLERIIEEQKNTLSHSNEIVVDALSAIIECRSVESGQHVLRLRHFTRSLLTELAAVCPEYNLDADTIASISGAAALHDIGKISIPDAILNKPGRLTKEEFEIMKTHSAAGSEILEQLGGIGNEEYLRYAYNICRYHHERWDGSGYPDGLAGDDIPICAQVVGLAAAFDALTSKRVYKDAYSCQTAVNMILGGECGTFSPKLLECFKHVQNEFFRLAEHYADNAPSISERIKEPLAPPGRTSSGALQTVLSKYEILLQYLNATVIEFDLDNNMYHSIYNPNPALSYLQNLTDLDQAMAMMAQSAHPDDKSTLTDQFREYLEMFFASGLRRSMRRYRLLGSDGSYRYYNVTCFHVTSSDSSRRILAIWEPAPEDTADGIARSSPAPSETASLLPDIRQYTRFDRWLTFAEITEEFCAFTGYTAEELRTDFHNHLLECILPESRKIISRQLTSQLAGDRSFVVELPLMKKDGDIAWVLGRGVLVTGEDGYEYLCGSMTDVSLLKKFSSSSSAVWSKEDHIQYLIQSNDIIFSWDAALDQLTCSPNWKNIFGYEPITQQAKAMILTTSHFHPDDTKILDKHINLLREGSDFTEFSVRIANSGGKYVTTLIRMCAKRDENGKLAKIIGRIIDLNSESELRIGYSKPTGRDGLTKLFDQESARYQIETHLANLPEDRIAALMIIDLDNFKTVNERHGHLFGDIVLTRIALEISGLFRSSDVVARIGGDEFLVYLPEIPRRELLDLRGTQLIERVKKIFDGQLSECGLACSVGIAFAPDHGKAYKELFQHADCALYSAKRAGKSCYVIYDPEDAPKSPTPPQPRTAVDSEL